jgi:hypothetical protein
MGYKKKRVCLLTVVDNVGVHFIFTLRSVKLTILIGSLLIFIIVCGGGGVAGGLEGWEELFPGG